MRLNFSMRLQFSMRLHFSICYSVCWCVLSCLCARVTLHLDSSSESKSRECAQMWHVIFCALWKISLFNNGGALFYNDGALFNSDVTVVQDDVSQHEVWHLDTLIFWHVTFCALQEVGRKRWRVKRYTAPTRSRAQKEEKCDCVALSDHDQPL